MEARVTRALVTVFLVATAFAGCGGGGSSSTPRTVASTTSTTIAPGELAITQLLGMKGAASKIEAGLKATPTDSEQASQGCRELGDRLATRADLLALSLPASAGNFVGKAVESAQDLQAACATGRLSGGDIFKAIGVEAQADLAVAVIRDPSKGVPTG